MIENGPGWVKIAHAETGGEAEITQASFDEPTGVGYVSFADRGWKIVEEYTDASTAPAPTPAPAPPFSGNAGGDD